MINFLTTLNLQEHIPKFQEEKINDLDALRKLTEEDLIYLGLKLGERRNFLNKLGESTQDLTVEVAAPSTHSIIYPNNLNPKDMVTYLAHPWEEYVREEHPSVKLHWLVDTAEVIVRWICALLLAEIRHANNNHLPEDIQKRFKENIARPTLGVWLIFVKELSQEKLEQTHLNGLFDIYQNELNVNGLFPDDGDDKTSLLKLRNRIAHGGGTTRSQAKEYLDIYAPRLESLLLSVNNIMSNAKLYGNFNDTCYVLQGLESTSEKCSLSIDGPYIKTGDTILSLWPLVEFDMVRQLDENGSLEEKTALTPQTYLRTDKQGVQYIPMGVEESYSITNKNKQEQFETIFGLNKKTEKSLKTKRHEYQHDDFLKEARYLKEELTGRAVEIETMKNWIKTVNAFDDKINCNYIYGGPGLGKSMLMASVAYNLSNDNNNHIFYYRFRGGDGRNNKQTFIKLLRDSLISWDDLSKVSDTPKDVILNMYDIIDDIHIRLDNITNIPAFPATEFRPEIRPIIRLFIDGLDEVLAEDRSMLRLIESFQKQGVITLIATRLENGAEELAESSWSQALVFSDDIDGLPPMSDKDIREMLLDGISKAQRKELIENDNDSEESLPNPIVIAISQKADGLPLYIHLLINDLQNRKYSLNDINKLPDGLNKYYYELVGRMGINDIDSYKAPLITLLSLTSEPIDIEAISLILNRINVAKDRESLMEDVVLVVGSLLKQVTTKEETIGYTLYHQSFRDFINKGENDKDHPLHYTLIDMKELLCERADQWRELPKSNFKNHLFRAGNFYNIAWQMDGVNRVKERLLNLEYLLARFKELQMEGIENFQKEYEVIEENVRGEEKEKVVVWNSFFKEAMGLLMRNHSKDWLVHQTLFQLAYDDGDNSPISQEADRLLDDLKIDFRWLRKKNRRKFFMRSGLLKEMRDVSHIIGVEVLDNGKIFSFSKDNDFKLWDNGEITIYQGHSKEIKGLKIFKDESVLSYSEDNTLRVWKDANEDPVVLEGHKGIVLGAEILKDEIIISYAEDKTVRLWSRDGKTSKILVEHKDIVNGVKILDEKHIVSYSDDKTIVIVNIDTLIKKTLIGHTGGVKGINILDDKRILSFSDDNTLRLWDEKREEPTLFEEHKDVVLGAVVLENGNILSYSEDNKLLLWSHDASEVKVLIENQPITQLVVMSNKNILTMSKSKTFTLYSGEGETLHEFVGHTDVVLGIEVLEDGRIISFAEDKTIRIWNEDAKQVNIFKGHTGNIAGLITLKKNEIVTYSGDKTIRLWNIKGEKSIYIYGHTGHIENAEIMNDRSILSYSKDSTLQKWDKDIKNPKILVQHTSPIKGVEVLENGKIFSFSKDNDFKLWDEGKITIYQGHSKEIKGLKIFKDESVLSYSADYTLRVWKDTNEDPVVLKGHKGIVLGAEILKDEIIISYANDKTVRLWSRDGKTSKILVEHKDIVNGVKILDEKHIVSYSNDKTIVIVNIDTLIKKTLIGHTGRVKGINILDDKRILSFSDDNTLRLWDEKREEPTLFEEHKDVVLGAVVLENGNILSYSKDNKLLLWSHDASEVKILEGHSGKIKGIKVLPDLRALTYGYDNTIIVWSDKGEKLTVFMIGVEKMNEFTITEEGILGSTGTNLYIYEFYNGNTLFI